MVHWLHLSQTNNINPSKLCVTNLLITTFPSYFILIAYYQHIIIIIIPYYSLCNLKHFKFLLISLTKIWWSTSFCFTLDLINNFSSLAICFRVLLLTTYAYLFPLFRSLQLSLTLVLTVSHHHASLWLAWALPNPQVLFVTPSRALSKILKQPFIDQSASLLSSLLLL